MGESDPPENFVPESLCSDVTVYDFSTFEASRAPGGHSATRRQAIVFLGNGLEFPNHNLEVVGSELPGIDVLRLASLQEVRDVSQRIRVNTTLLVIAEERRDDLIDDFERYSKAAEDARLVFAYEDPANAAKVLQSCIGPVVDYLPMRCRIDAWAAYIRLLCASEKIIPRDLLADRQRAEKLRDGEKDTATIRLTRRENEILALVAEGSSNREIASAIGVSEHTVKLHLHNAFAKLNVSNRAGAVAWYFTRAV